NVEVQAGDLARQAAGSRADALVSPGPQAVALGPRGEGLALGGEQEVFAHAQHVAIPGELRGLRLRARRGRGPFDHEFGPARLLPDEVVRPVRRVHVARQPDVRGDVLSAVALLVTDYDVPGDVDLLPRVEAPERLDQRGHQVTVEVGLGHRLAVP